ncbi:Protein translocase subunit SecY [uncultured archaeon]|nr:Protein translocase subunit SecY [uncultured archaeon]
MGLVDILSTISKMLPEVKAPAKPVAIKEKIMWTVAALVIFFVMYNVTAFGVSPRVVTSDFLQVITASKLGSLLTVGIGPIVLASIFLQLFKGAGLINLDLSNPDQRKKFHEAQKVLAVLLAFLEAGIFVFTGRTILIDQTAMTAGLVILQIALGAIILFYLDEIISKYGIGSGISLFIAAGVSLSIIGGLSSLIFGDNGVTQTLIGGGADAIPSALLILLPFLFTVLVFLAVVYAEGMKVEIPVAYEAARGIIPKLPLKFFYVSNIPVIFASALLLNVQLFAAPLIGVLDSQNWTVGGQNIANYIGYVSSDKLLHDGALYLITPVFAAKGTLAHWNFLSTATTPIFGIPEWAHALIYIIFLIGTSIIFGVFWSETSGMDSKSVAGQLGSAGLQIPGYRRDPRLLEKVLEKYIGPLIITSSAAVGLLAGLADLTGALGTGTGILLTVGIMYKLYEDFEKLQVFDVYPQISGMFTD